MFRSKSIFYVASFIFMSNSWSWTLTDTENKMFAISECEPFVDIHNDIIDHLDEYVLKEQKRLSIIKSHLLNYKKEQTLVIKENSNYIRNSFNAFIMILRLTADLNRIKENIHKGIENSKDLTEVLQMLATKLPTEEDLKGAGLAVRRVQATYKLDIHELAEGRMNGATYRFPMSAEDCFTLSSILWDFKDYFGAEAWILEALRKYKLHEHDTQYLTNDLLISSLGKIQKAAKIYRKDLKTATSETEELHIDNYSLEDNSREHEAALCRGELAIPYHISKSLTCFLMAKHPFLLLAPIKTEQLCKDPDIFIFYDVISDEEIEHVKKLSQPILKRAMVIDSRKDANILSDYRIGKLAGLKDESSAVVSRISQRAKTFTGLDLVNAEMLQVVNYGIGGHYVSHYDFAVKHQPQTAASRNFGNRIATVLFYMSEVHQGGATVFPELDVSVSPVKNAALLWMNLLPSGEGDLLTLHAACPVLNGSKWIATKWFRQIGQELLKPCTLDYQDENTYRQILWAV